MELFRALAAFAEPPAAEHARLSRLLGLPAPPAQAEYTSVFLLHLYPYASIYLSAEGMMGGEAQDRVAGVWRVLKQTPPPEPDHLAALLSLYATVAEWEEAESGAARRLLRRQTRKALLWEHLACWLFPYLEKMEEIAPPFHRAWAQLLRSALAAEIEALGPQASLPLHLREAPPLPHPEEDGMDAFLDGLLAPVRSGLILTRADLARAAKRLGLGMRLGERKFILRGLIFQDPPSMLGWLADDAREWTHHHLRLAGVTGDVGRFWVARSDAAAATLKALQAEAHRSAGWRERDRDASTR